MSANAHRVNRRQIRTVSTAATATAILLLIWACAAAAAGPTAGDGGITFTYAAPQASQVFLAGDFNGWNATAMPLTKGDDGLWSVTVTLAAGACEYKFIVDGNWVEDPANPQKVSDPFGGSNSLVTVLADGTLDGGSTTPAAAAKPAAPAAGSAAPGDFTVGAPVVTEDGILFTTSAPGAGQVFLAGTFNGWNASEVALTNDGKGNWAVVHKLDPGQYEYKFVVDGNWLADAENPQTQSDPYGGVNSLVVVDDAGQLVEAAVVAPADGAAPIGSPLNAKMSISGRYLTRFELAKNVMYDPRYRLLRPSQSVDLNFDTKVNDLVEAFMRLRMDSNDNVILNNIAGSLDEASLTVHPDKFDIKAYWNQEIFTSEDPLNLVGDVDHPATPGHDHLQFGKGTAGALIEAFPFGLRLQGLFANVHNFDYYNNPNLFDNTGGDRVYLRLSRQVGPIEVGVPLWLRRELLWLNFETLVGLPSTGIPAVDDYLDETGDSSTWFETENHQYHAGLDFSLPLRDKTMKLGAQLMFVDEQERLVIGNQAGQNNVNGSIDVPFLEREETMLGLRWDYKPGPNTSARVRHTYRDMKGAHPDQRTILIGFVDQSIAENRVVYAVAESPAPWTYHLTEAEAAWKRGDRDLKLYLWRAGLEEDYAAVGRTVPGSADRTSRTIETWYLSGLVGKGDAKDRYGHAELEFGVLLQDPDIEGEDYETYEFIGRYQRRLSKNLTALVDVRWIRYMVQVTDPTSGGIDSFDDEYWAPFAGIQYHPIRNLELVFGYGLDPVELSIDYEGRQFGRWWYRQRFLANNPNAGFLDAEQNLEDARIFTLRAQMKF